MLDRSCLSCSSSRVVASGPHSGRLACFVFGYVSAERSCVFWTPETGAYRGDSEGLGLGSASIVKSAAKSQIETKP